MNPPPSPAAVSPIHVVSSARAAATAAVAVALLILGLHVIKPEFEPSWRFISEYAIGQNGWIMKLAFLIWGSSCVALSFALRREAPTWLGKLGCGVLLIVGVALVFAGLFPQDPVTARPDELTPSGNIHALASMIGIPGLPSAAMMISASLVGNSARWRPHRRAIMWSAHATWLSLLLMALYLMWAVPRAGGFDEGVWAGWMNRLVVSTYLLWQWVTRRLVDLQPIRGRRASGE